jgi:hypothetical protein
MIQKTAKLSAFPGLACFIALLLWSDKIKSFSEVLFYLMAAIFIVGLVSSQIQGHRDDRRFIEEQAVEKFKRENNITS